MNTDYVSLEEIVSNLNTTLSMPFSPLKSYSTNNYIQKIQRAINTYTENLEECRNIISQLSDCQLSKSGNLINDLTEVISATYRFIENSELEPRTKKFLINERLNYNYDTTKNQNRNLRPFQQMNYFKNLTNALHNLDKVLSAGIKATDITPQLLSKSDRLTDTYYSETALARAIRELLTQYDKAEGKIRDYKEPVYKVKERVPDYARKMFPEVDWND